MSVLRANEIARASDKWLKERGQSPQSLRDQISADAREGLRTQKMNKGPSLEHVAQQIERESRGDC